MKESYLQIIRHTLAVILISNSIGHAGSFDKAAICKWEIDRLIPAKWSAGCGVDALFISLSLLGMPQDYYQLAEMCKITKASQRTDLDTLLDVAQKLSLHGRGIRADKKQVSEILKNHYPSVAILHLNATEKYQEHLACAYLNKNKGISVSGFENGGACKLGNFWEDRWSGAAIILSRKNVGENPANLKKPFLKINQETYNVGDVPSGGKASYHFVIFNTGDAPLHIKDIIKSCNCTSLNLSQNVILPNESLELIGEIKVSSLIGKGDVRLSILSDDPTKKRQDLFVYYNVLQPTVLFSKTNIVLPDLIQGIPVVKTVKLSYLNDREVGLKFIPSQNWVKVALDETKKEMLISVTPDWDSGEKKSYIRIQTAYKEEFLMLVEATVSSPIDISQTKIFWERKENESFLEQHLKIYPKNNSNITNIFGQITGVNGEVTVKKDKSSKNWNIDIKIGPIGEEDKMLVGSLELFLQGVSIKTISVPIYIP